MSGAFEIFEDSSGNKVVRQNTPQRPQTWEKDLLPVALFGDQNWLNTSVEAKLFLEPGEGQSAFIGARSMWSPSSYQDKSGCGVYLVMDPTGSWSLYGRIEDIHTKTGIIQQGKVPGGSASGKWMKLLLQVEDNHVRGWHNDILLFDITGNKVPMCKGWAAIGTTEYRPAQFDDITVRAGQAVQESPVQLSSPTAKAKQTKVDGPQQQAASQHKQPLWLEPREKITEEDSVKEELVSTPLIWPHEEDAVKDKPVSAPSIRPHAAVVSPIVKNDSAKQSKREKKRVQEADTSRNDSLTIFRAFFCLLACCILAAFILCLWHFTRKDSTRQDNKYHGVKWWERADEFSGHQGAQSPAYGIHAYRQSVDRRARG